MDAISERASDFHSQTQSKRDLTSIKPRDSYNKQASSYRYNKDYDPLKNSNRKRKRDSFDDDDNDGDGEYDNNSYKDENNDKIQSEKSNEMDINFKKPFF